MELIVKSEKHGEKIILIDDEDYNLIKNHTWRVGKYGKNFYVITTIFKNKKPKTIRMHRMITKAPKGKIVDHKNHNTLDNRKENLRICEHKNNMHNSRRQVNCTSKYKGVYYNKWQNTYTCQIKLNGKSMHLGNFESEIDAALVYNGAAKCLHGEFAYLNNI